MYIENIDYLSATIDILHYEKSVKELLEYLELEKENASMLNLNHTNSKHYIKIGSESFYILANGSKGYSYLLHNDIFEVNFSKYRSKKENLYPIKIRIKSEMLWSYGISNAWEYIKKWVIDNVGEIRANKISRLDICCHTDNFEFQYESLSKFKGKFRDSNINILDRKITGFAFGTRKSKKMYARIYNKSLEVSKKKTNSWLTY